MDCCVGHCPEDTRVHSGRCGQGMVLGTCSETPEIPSIPGEDAQVAEVCAVSEGSGFWFLHDLVYSCGFVASVTFGLTEEKSDR